MKYMIIAGEASGDLHGSELIRSILELDPGADIVFFGGDAMARVTGRAPVVHTREMAFMGFSEVIRNTGKIRRNFRKAKHLLEEFKPDALILIDYPSFNLKVAKSAKKAGVKVFYYISPKVWAWKEFRVRTIKKLVDRMLVIFPFEVSFYRDRHDYHVEYVGNPSVTEVDNLLESAPSRAEFLAANGLRDRKIIALLPGSRTGEIRNNLPVMLKAVERFPQYRGVIAGAPDIDRSFYASFSDLPVVYNDTVALLKHSEAALVTSGTATLEAALVGVPQIACYRSNGKKLAYQIMKKILKVKFVTLPNLIAGREIIPELLLHLCTPDALSEKLIPLLRDSEQKEEMLSGYAEMRAKLETPDTAPGNAARSILRVLKS